MHATQRRGLRLDARPYALDWSNLPVKWLEHTQLLVATEQQSALLYDVHLELLGALSFADPQVRVGRVGGSVLAAGWLSAGMLRQGELTPPTACCRKPPRRQGSSPACSLAKYPCCCSSARSCMGRCLLPQRSGTAPPSAWAPGGCSRRAGAPGERQASTCTLDLHACILACTPSWFKPPVAGCVCNSTIPAIQGPLTSPAPTMQRCSDRPATAAACG